MALFPNTTTIPSSSSSLSADEIAQTLGYADAAAMVAAIAAGGSAILNGAGAPDNGTGNNGDYYLNTSNGDFYQKSGGAWGSPIVNLTGPQGPAGAGGAQGPAGPAPSGTGLVQVASGVASTLALGTALHGVRVNAAGTAYETAEITATDSTKVAKAGDTISGDLLNSASIRIGPNTSNGSDNLALTLGHTDATRGGQIVITGNEHGSQGKVQIRAGDVGRLVEFMDTGSTVCTTFSSYTGEWNFKYPTNFEKPVILAAAARISGAIEGQIHSNNNAGVIGLEAIAADYAFMCAGGGPGGTKAGVEVFGASHSGNAGAVVVRPEPIAIASDGAFHNIFSLAAGTHIGSFFFFVRSTNATTYDNAWSWWNIRNGSDLALYYNSPTNGITTENPASATTTNIVFDISGGNVRAKAGTAVPATVYIAVYFFGMVY